MGVLPFYYATLTFYNQHFKINFVNTIIHDKYPWVNDQTKQKFNQNKKDQKCLKRNDLEKIEWRTNLENKC